MLAALALSELTCPKLPEASAAVGPCFQQSGWASHPAHPFNDSYNKIVLTKYITHNLIVKYVYVYFL